MSAFTFLKLTRDDIPQIMNWLAQPHVAEWFGEPGEWLEEIEENWNSDWIWHFRVECDGRPLGFAQCYWCDRAPDGPWSEMPPRTLGLDYFIGSGDDTGKGLGKAMIAAFVDYVVRMHNPKHVMADPDLDNAPSVKALERLGFHLHEQSGLMVKSIG